MMTVLRKLALGIAVAGLVGLAGCGEDNEANALGGAKDTGDTGGGPPPVAATSSEDYYKQTKAAAEKAGISGSAAQGKNFKPPKSESPEAK
jgi:hypothetical protein